jgi:hypothetical protein
MYKFLKKFILLNVMLAFAGAAFAADKFRADLSGDQEVSPVVTDTTGDFRLTFDDFEGTATYRLKIREGTRITQAHIHCAPAGANGSVVVFLAGFHGAGWDVDGKWIDNATLTDVNIVNNVCGATLAELIEEMRNGNTYVNVHTIANPGGEVRGQIREQ